MNRSEFLKEISKRLIDFDKEERDKIIEYYDELISDYCDEGYSEDEAIKKLGDIDHIIKNIKADIVIERSNKKNSNSFKNFIIILGICSSPVLIPIGVSFFITFLAIAFALFIVFLSLSFGSVASLFGTIFSVIDLIASGDDIGFILIVLGIGLMSTGLLGLLAYYLYQLSSLILNYINKAFSKLIKKKTIKEVEENV